MSYNTEKFSVFAPFLLLSVVIVTLPGTPTYTTCEMGMASVCAVVMRHSAAQMLSTQRRSDSIFSRRHRVFNTSGYFLSTRVEERRPRTTSCNSAGRIITLQSINQSPTIFHL